LAEARALVLGGGSVGLLAALLLRHQGCVELWLGDINPLRRETAAMAGPFHVFDPGQEQPTDDSFDLVIDAVGAASTRAMASKAVRAGGVIMHIGLADSSGEMDVRRMTLAQITFIGTYTYTPVDLRAAVDKLHGGALGELAWTEQRTLADGAGAFEDLLRGRSAAAKIILKP
jgi:alcohol dehydrogenase